MGFLVQRVVFAAAAVSVVVGSPWKAFKAVPQADRFKDPSLYHLHSLDPLGRRIFHPSVTPASMFCPAW